MQKLLTQRAVTAKAVVEGCRDMADTHVKLEQDFHPLEEEVARGIDAVSEADRHDADSA